MIESFQIPARLRENVQMYFGCQGEEWLNTLPKLLQETAQKWSLKIGRPYQNLSINYVTSATREDGSQVVLKLGVPNREISTEIEALSRFDGRGAVRLIGSDAQGGLLILEKIIPGTPLLEDPNNLDAVKIAAGVMKTIWRPAPSEHNFPTLEGWFSGLKRLRERFDGGTGPFPSKLFEMAETLSAEMIESTKVPMLLHGDCHHQNIVRSDDRGWLTIDPKGVVGDPVYELCAFLRNPLDLHERFNLTEALPRRVRAFAEILSFDFKRIASWGLAEAVLSACWDIDGDPVNRDQTLKVAEVYAKML